MNSSNFSIENILSAAKSFSPSTTAMMLNAQQAFMALNSLQPAAATTSPFDYFNPYAFPPTTSQAFPFSAAAAAASVSQFPFWLAASAAGGFPPYPPYGPSSFIPAVMNGKRKRRHRTIFSEHQLNILEKTFNTVTHYPDVPTRDRLAAECGLKEERVEVWFKNRRAKDRKKNPEENKKPSGKSSGSAGATNSSASGNGSSTSNSLHSDEEEEEEEEELELSDAASDSEHHHHSHHQHHHSNTQVSPASRPPPMKRKRLSNSSNETPNVIKYAKLESRENTIPSSKLTPLKKLIVSSSSIPIKSETSA